MQITLQTRPLHEGLTERHHTQDGRARTERLIALLEEQDPAVLSGHIDISFDHLLVHGPQPWRHGALAIMLISGFLWAPVLAGLLFLIA